jgi:8-oxo-dGTP diphosphatase
MLRLILPLWRLIQNKWKWRILYLLHAKFMVAVVGIILDDERRVLLLRHRFWKEDRWGLPSGYAQRREQLEDTLAREVAEETRLSIADVRLVRVASGFRLWIEVTYRARIAGGTLHLDRREILDARFFAPDELPASLPAPQREMVARVQREANLQE